MSSFIYIKSPWWLSSKGFHKGFLDHGLSEICATLRSGNFLCQFVYQGTNNNLIIRYGRLRLCLYQYRMHKRHYFLLNSYKSNFKFLHDVLGLPVSLSCKLENSSKANMAYQYKINLQKLQFENLENPSYRICYLKVCTVQETTSMQQGIPPDK